MCMVVMAPMARRQHVTTTAPYRLANTLRLQHILYFILQHYTMKCYFLSLSNNSNPSLLHYRISE